MFILWNPNKSSIKSCRVGLMGSLIKAKWAKVKFTSFSNFTGNVIYCLFSSFLDFGCQLSVYVMYKRQVCVWTGNLPENAVQITSTDGRIINGKLVLSMLKCIHNVASYFLLLLLHNQKKKKATAELPLDVCKQHTVVLLCPWMDHCVWMNLYSWSLIKNQW